MISLGSEILAQVIFVVLLSKGHMVVTKIRAFETKDMLEPVRSCHLTNLILSLHSLIHFRFLKHLFEEEIFIDAFIFDLGVDGALLLNIYWALTCTFVRKILEKGKHELVAEYSLEGCRAQGREGGTLALFILSLELSLGSMLALGFPCEHYGFVGLHTNSLHLLLSMTLAVVLLQVTWVGVGLAAALTNILAILPYMLHVLALVIFVFELHVAPQIELSTEHLPALFALQ